MLGAHLGLFICRISAVGLQEKALQRIKGGRRVVLWHQVAPVERVAQR